MNKLGKWAVIDIETSGIDPSYDRIIDVGFLQFDGLELVSKYRSLVHFEGELSHFIQKLTGISDKMIKSAPTWEEVSHQVMSLQDHYLIAHNAPFEASFLEREFDDLNLGKEKNKSQETYCDSLPYLALLFLGHSRLNLERFIVDLGIGDCERHRGLEDSIDLLKVLLLSTALTKENYSQANYLSSMLDKHKMEDWWYYHFFSLNLDELTKLADSVDFDLEYALSEYRSSEVSANKPEDNLHTHNDESSPNFDMEFSGDNMAKIYQSEEEVQKVLPNYNYRSMQEELSNRVGQAFKHDVHALVQAPTGTGKTLGYLLPSALFTISHGEQVLISTATRVLQNQIIEKDIPQLKTLISPKGRELKTQKLVGSANHLCELLFRQGNLHDADDWGSRFSSLYMELVFHYNSSVDSDAYLLKDDLPYALKKTIPPLEKLSKSLAVDFRFCTGNKCPFASDCSYISNIRQAKEADIIVGNHALTFSWPKGFPRPSYIVVDEGHKIEDSATKSFTLEVSQRDLENLCANLENAKCIGPLFYLLSAKEKNVGESTETINQIKDQAIKAQQRLGDQLQFLPENIERYFQKMPKYSDVFWNEVPMIRKGEANNQLAINIIDSFENIFIILSDFLKALTDQKNNFTTEEMEDEQEVTALANFEAFYCQLADLLDALSVSMNISDDDQDEIYSKSLKYHAASEGYLLSSAPIDIGKVLHEKLLETSSSVVFTSATLGNAKGDRGIKGLEWATGYTYLAPEKRFKSGLFLPPAYDCNERTRIFLCDDTPMLYQNSFVEDSLLPIMDLIANLTGGSLLLYSAKSRFNLAREMLLARFEGVKPLFIQGMGNSIIDDFRNSKGGILLGMESLGEGIDVPGEALQFIFIDKIPDMRMEKVIQDRRDFYQSNIGNEFVDYYLAHRTRSLQQKLGRLIRSKNDSGAVIIVDGRIKNWKGRTMEQLTKLMEPYQLRRSTLIQACADAEEFIRC